MDKQPQQAKKQHSHLVIGVLGGIASGKSYVASLLAGEKGAVIDADRLAHEVLASKEVTELVAEAFGKEVLGEDGRPDRSALAERVFDDPSARARLEGWIHPRVRAKIQAALDEAMAQEIEPVVLDVPLLLENDDEHGLVAKCDHLVFIECDLEARDQRAVLSRGWSPGEVAHREQSQNSLADKKARADYTIENRGSLEDLDQSARALREQLLTS
ncbi:MAG: dephospho-CoA kinase [Planctomycetota bacterium]|nr:dephospho-CoA kinase [Planctomycetota bacterium]